MTASPIAASPAAGSSTAKASDPAGSYPDRITLRGLRVRGQHGVLPAERELGQEFIVDAVIWLDMTAAARDDDVTLTVHYGELAEELAAIVAGPPANLIETLALRLVDACLRPPRVIRAEVTVHKPAAPIPLVFGDVAVTVARDRLPVVSAAGHCDLGRRGTPERSG
ncbi:dihydroneopterin aldolase [Frankia sp. AiPa1]|uniref:dihydroneopterin aldolase n=1 Tax=Frankia sp. AiPa1 TaxID=573492 RepID=UPI00202B3E24|nr:dihydroneopterin aldolase [Frankia sp. AiPa1]MCL9761134.1 dihydroneopterin aldolase [Frankia sp. AiPa1]